MNDLMHQPPTRQRFAPAALLLAMLCLAGPVAGQFDRSLHALRNEIFSQFEAHNYAQAAQLLEQYVQRAPEDATMRYNLACAYALTGQRDQAADALYDAVKHGFRDFDHMKRDPDLASIRDHKIYQAIVEASERVEHNQKQRTPWRDRARVRTPEQAIEQWRSTYGEDDYRFAIDEKHRLAFALSIDEETESQMRAMLERQADHLIENLFEAPPEDYVLIAVATPRDARRIFDRDSVGGMYEHNRRRLVVRDIGQSLRHEFVHAYHYGHMERLGQVHPIWIQEGIAALYESYKTTESGRIEFLPSERHNIIRKLIQNNRAMPWTQMFELSGRQFMRKPGALYPQVRSIFEYLADENKLSAWYAAYIRTFDENETGARALEMVFDQDVNAIEKNWRRWVLSRPKVDTSVAPGDASLGVQVRAMASNDGVLIDFVFEGSGADRAGLRAGDIIVSVDGRATRSMRELRDVVAQLNVDQRVEVRLRRDGRYLTRTVTLQPLGGHRH